LPLQLLGHVIGNRPGMPIARGGQYEQKIRVGIQPADVQQTHLPGFLLGGAGCQGLGQI
jgi:hypothetical protein